MSCYLSRWNTNACCTATCKTDWLHTKNSAIGCTSYIVDDSQAKFLETLCQIDNIAVLSCDPCLHNSQHFGLRSYADGFVKEGAGAGGAIIASLLKTEIL